MTTPSLDPTQPAQRPSKGMTPRNIILIAMAIVISVVLVAGVAMQNKANQREAERAAQASKPELGQAPSPEEIAKMTSEQKAKAEADKAKAAKEAEAVEPSVRVLAGSDPQSMTQYARAGQTPTATALVQGSTSQSGFLLPPRSGDFAAGGAQTAPSAPAVGDPSLNSAILVSAAKGSAGAAVRKAAEAAGAPPQLADAVAGLVPNFGSAQMPSMPSPAALAAQFTPQRPPTQFEQNQSFLKDAQQLGSSNGALRAVRPEASVMLMQGTVIQAVSESAINSDLPGNIRALVSQDVYDSLRGNELLIPKGSRLVGSYNANVASAQSRILMVFSRLILPDGRSVDLQGMSGGDTQGRAGMTGDINHHFLRNFGAGFLVAGLTYALGKRDPTVNINVTSSTGQPVTLSSAAGQILIDTAKQAIETYRQPRPTITIDGGTPFSIVVQRDMVLDALARKQVAPAFDAISRASR